MFRDLSEQGSKLAKEGSCVTALNFIHEIIQEINIDHTFICEKNKFCNGDAFYFVFRSVVILIIQ